MVLFFTVVLVQQESVTPSHPAIAKIINTNLFQEKLLLTNVMNGYYVLGIVLDFSVLRLV